MNISQLLTDLAQRGIKISANGDQLQVQAPKGALGPELRESIAQHKSELLELLREGPLEARGEPQAPIVPCLADRHLPFPLTDIQKAYWLGRSGAFTVPTGIHVYREYDCIDLDIDRLLVAFRKVVARHDMLRAHTLPDMLQVVEPDLVGEIEIVDLRVLSVDERERRLMEIREAMSHRIYDTDKAPLYHLVAAHFDDRTTRLVVSIDAINVDGGSFAILCKELVHFYEKPDAMLPSLALTYRDYVFALEARKHLASYQRSFEYWQRRAVEIAPAPVLPMAREPGTLEKVRFEHISFHIEKDEWTRLEKRAKAAKVSPSIVCLTAYAEVLGRFSSSGRLTVNVTLFNRLPIHPAIESIIGDFTSMLLISIDTMSKQTFAERVRSVQQQLWEAMEHREVSGIDVQREVARAWGEHRGALFPVVFTSLQNHKIDGLHALEKLGKPVYGITQTPQLVLDQQLWQLDGDAKVIWDVVLGVFPEGFIQEMFGAYIGLIRKLANEDAPWNAAAVDVLPEGQKAHRMAVNATDDSPIPEDLLHELFERQVDATHDKPAVLTSDRVFTYADIDRRANQVAHQLRARGIGPDKLVPIVMEKGWEQIVAVFGVLKAGGAYVPLDAASSEERLDRMIRDSKATVILTQSKIIADATWAKSVEVLVVDDAPVDEFMTRLPSVQRSDNLAYVLYTSGSTGQPKGAMIAHRSVTNRMTEVKERFGLVSGDRAIALTALHHDLSVFDIFCVLGVVGGAIVLPDADKTRDPAHWVELVHDHHVTLWNSVPTFMQMLVEHAEGNANLDPGMLTSLRWAIFSGDFIPVDLPNRLRALRPGIALIGAGGPTETTVWDICYPMGDIDPSWKSIPYGRPMRAAQYHIFDDQLRERPDWVPGEMYIGGVGLARGYWRDEEKTRERFITHPATGERLYKSGDIGRWLLDGNIEILGRADFQVKIRGYRIELGEVEAAIQTHPDVRNAVVLALGTTAKDKRLCAYVVRDAHAHDDPPQKSKLFLDDAEKVEFKLAHHGLRKDLDNAPTIALETFEKHHAKNEAYARRRSVRTFLDKPVPLANLGRLLSLLAAFMPDGAILPKYLYPSGGSLYPVQTYVYVKPDRIEGVSAGYYYFDPHGNRLRKVSDEMMDASSHASTNIDIFDQAAFVLLFVGKLSAVEPVYGSAARDFCLLEAGYMGQLLMSHAPSQNLGLCPLGYVDFERLRLALGVEPSSFCVHGILGGVADDAQFSISALASESAPPKKKNAVVFSDELRGFLQKKLPEYMIPTTFFELDALPITSNGKVDRKALLALESRATTPPTDKPAVPPSELETKMAEIVTNVIGISEIRLGQNFFDAGATSLHIIIIAKRLREQLGLDMPVTLLFQAPNIAALAAALTVPEPQTAPKQKALDRADARRKARTRR